MQRLFFYGAARPQVLDSHEQELAVQNISIYAVLFNFEASSRSCDAERIGNSQEKEIPSFSWKRHRVKRKLLLAAIGSRDKELYTSENGKFDTLTFVLPPNRL